MTNDQPIHHRKSIRLPGYDYTLAGAYFITLVNWRRECLFGEVTGNFQIDGTPEMRLNPYGGDFVQSLAGNCLDPAKCYHG